MTFTTTPTTYHRHTMGLIIAAYTCSDRIGSSTACRLTTVVFRFAEHMLLALLSLPTPMTTCLEDLV